MRSHNSPLVDMSYCFTSHNALQKCFTIYVNMRDLRELSSFFYFYLYFFHSPFTNIQFSYSPSEFSTCKTLECASTVCCRFIIIFFIILFFFLYFYSFMHLIPLFIESFGSKRIPLASISMISFLFFRSHSIYLSLFSILFFFCFTRSFFFF